MAQRVIIRNGTEWLIPDGETDTGTVGVGGMLDVGAGGSAVGFAVAGGETVLSGGSDNGAQILDGGVQTIQSGGIANDVTIDTGGMEIVQSGGVASNTVISGGVLDVQYGGTLSGTLTFTGAGTLQIDSTSMPAVTIYGFVNPSQTIDLTGLSYSGSGSAVLTGNNVLNVTEGTQTFSLQLDSAQNYAGHSFTLGSDGHGGTAVVDPVVGLNTWDVDTEGGANSGDSALNGVIQAIDVGGGNYGTGVHYTINLTQNINLTQDLFAINLGSGSTLTINGNGYTIDGMGNQRGFFVYQGNVSIENLAITNAVAKGGNAATHGGGGGGGAGLGGGLFIAGTSGGRAGASVTLYNVTFSNDRAIGGNGGGTAGGNQPGGGGGGGGLGVLPVCIKAGALGDNVPKRDLWISPHHAMYFEGENGGMLIEAKDLVNGTSIVQAQSVEKVEYFHIELDTHDVIVAEGALSETFLDGDNRGIFHNAHEYDTLYSDAPSELVYYCALRIEEGYELEGVRRRIASRAGQAADANLGALRGYVDATTATHIKGWAQNVDCTEMPVCLDVYVGSQLIGQALANRYRDDLAKAGLGGGRHSFVFRVPAGVTLTPETVEVRRSFDGAPLKRSASTRRKRARAAVG